MSCGRLEKELNDSIIHTNYGDSATPSMYHTVIDERLQPIVDDFLHEDFCNVQKGGVNCASRLSLLKTISFNSAALHGNAGAHTELTLGVCIMKRSIAGMRRSQGGRFVPAITSGDIFLLDEQREATNEDLKALLYHELGHCIFYKNHYPASRGINLMNPIEINPKFFTYSWSWVLSNFAAYLLSPYGIDEVAPSWLPLASDTEDETLNINFEPQSSPNLLHSQEQINFCQ